MTVSTSPNGDQISTVLSLIGHSPMVKVLDHSKRDITVFGKAEFLNPGGSIKDRVAKYLIEEAERTGQLKPGMIIAEATSGNTGIGVALVGRSKGYRVVVIMPASMSEERKKLVQALGADLILTPTEQSIQGSVDKLEELARINDNIWRMNQFTNPNNPKIHALTTGPELFEQMAGKIDAFVAGVGSGGTLQGVGSYLKKELPDIKLVAVEPDGYSALLGIEPGLHVIHQIQGIGDGFIPDNLDTGLVDEIITVSDDDAVYTTRKLARTQGLLVGTSAGANVYAARLVAEELGPDARVATILPDRAERYFSTALL